MLRALVVIVVAGAAKAVPIGPLPDLPIHFSLFDDPPERWRIPIDDLGKIPFVGGLATKLIPTTTRVAEKPKMALLETAKENMANKAVITANPVLHTAVYPVGFSSLSPNRVGVPDIKMNVPLFDCSIIEKLPAAGRELCTFGNQMSLTDGKLQINKANTVDAMRLDNVDTSSAISESLRRPVRSPSLFSGVAVAEATGTFSGSGILPGKSTANSNLDSGKQMEQDSGIFGDFAIKLMPSADRQLNNFGNPLGHTVGVLAKTKVGATGTFGAFAGEVVPTADIGLNTIGNQIGLTGGQVVKAKANAAHNLSNLAVGVVPSAWREFDNIGNQAGLAGGMAIKAKAEILGSLGSLSGEVVTTAQRQRDNIGSQVGKTGAVLIKEKAGILGILSG